jgi:hypothetical protein
MERSVLEIKPDGAVRVSDEYHNHQAVVRRSGCDVLGYLALFQRAATAFLAMDFRFAGDSAAARACPPFDAPSFDSATAAGSRVSGTSAGFSAWPVAS